MIGRMMVLRRTGECFLCDFFTIYLLPLLIFNEKNVFPDKNLLNIGKI